MPDSSETEFFDAPKALPVMGICTTVFSSGTITRFERLKTWR